MLRSAGLAVQVPIDARDRLLAREGLDPAQLRNLQLIYKEPQVGSITCLVLADEAAHLSLQHFTLAPVLQMEGDLVHRKRLEELKPESFTSILILADEAARMGLSGQLASLASQSSNTADSDSRSLASLLLLRDIQTQNMAKGECMQQGSAGCPYRWPWRCSLYWFIGGVCWPPWWPYLWLLEASEVGGQGGTALEVRLGNRLE